MKPIFLVLLAGGALAAAPYWQTGFWEAFRSDNYDPYSRDGRFDIRAIVDHEVEFAVRGGRVFYRTLAGRPPFDEGSEYRKEIPRGEMYGLRLEQRDGRGEMWIVETPSPRNGYALVVRVSDPKGGDDRYHARITWEADSVGERGRDRFRGPRGREDWRDDREWRGRDWRDDYRRR